jgi:hypothetical protein
MLWRYDIRINYIGVSAVILLNAVISSVIFLNVVAPCIFIYLFEDFLQPVGLNRYGVWSLGNSFKNFFYFKFTLKNVSNSFLKQEKVFK